MRVTEVREKFLTFMKGRGHSLIPSASLVPQDDATTLFTSSGMQPLIPYLMGEEHPKGVRLANSQKCFRANDIEIIGDNRHTTFFEMLGNWSLGVYFKEEQIKQCFVFLTDPVEGLGLDPQRLFVTVFAGDERYGLPRDTTSAEIWRDLFSRAGVSAEIAHIGSVEEGDRRGMQEGERIFFYDSTKNWWSRAGAPEHMPPGELGGGDTEVFFDFGSEHQNTAHTGRPHPNSNSGQFMEICNSVFMEYRRDTDAFVPLDQKNVDFGGGLERLAAATNNNPDIFRIDTFQEIVEHLEMQTQVPYDRAQKDYRMIADHLRSAVSILNGGVVPATTGSGYVLRRLIRRLVYRLQTSFETPHTIDGSVVKCIVHHMPDAASQDYETLYHTLQQEEKQFITVLEVGKEEYHKLLKQGKVNAMGAFLLQSTYGFPFEFTCALAEQDGITIAQEDYQTVMEEHRTQSRAGGMFKGGLADESDACVRYHTATHLLHQALREVLGNEVEQRGSNITQDRLRFDFLFSRKVTDEEKASIERLVNEQIQADLPVTHEDMPLGKARKIGAIGLFGESYGDTVRVYTIGTFSKEFCGGPHVERTGVLGTFSIVSEKSIAEGTRRIRAVLQ